MLPASRLRLLVVLLAGWATIVWLRLGFVQLVSHREWAEIAARQREATIEVEEPRGEILSADGRILAGSLERVSVYANPARIPRERWEELAGKLSAIVGLEAEDILRRFAARDRFFFLAKNLDPAITEGVDRLRVRGLGVMRTQRRIHPHGPLAAAVLGFVNGEGVGQAGLEKAYDRTLAGTPSVYRLLRDGKSIPTPLDLRLEQPGRPGLSLQLTLDTRIQAAVEEELSATLASIGGRGASAVVMDPATGAVLALASLPSFHPDAPGASPPETWRNRAVEDASEPGSSFKPIIVAAALAGGGFRSTDLIDCSGGGVQVAGVFMRDHARYGMLSVREVIAFSSNAGSIRIAQRLSPALLDTTIRDLGFGAPTGIELPGETRGLLLPSERWSALSRAGLALGQELTASPLQLARAYAVFANGGYLVQPRLVRATLDESGAVVTPARVEAPRRVLPSEVAQQITAMLAAVVEEGTGKRARLASYSTAGKTGTAQKAVGGVLRSGRHVAWFAGFFPLPRPRAVIVVCIDEPRSTYWASEVAAPTFGRIAERLVTIMGLPPSEAVRL
ncbi:MAG: penicillin-binding protein 2 [Acidobacteriota bacterium]|mgnify:CR=1 FL=1|jgi:cell division protein FtsI/penicillin-binding protein 2